MDDDMNSARSTPETTSAAEPSGPPVDPAERPRIEPTDALPADEDGKPGLAEKAKSFLGDGEHDSRPAQPATPGEEPTPPPVNPAERPRIEPADALPTEEKQ
jgi:hypothetical protein